MTGTLPIPAWWRGIVLRRSLRPWLGDLKAEKKRSRDVIMGTVKNGSAEHIQLQLWIGEKKIKRLVSRSGTKF